MVALPSVLTTTVKLPPLFVAALILGIESCNCSFTLVSKVPPSLSFPSKTNTNSELGKAASPFAITIETAPCICLALAISALILAFFLTSPNLGIAIAANIAIIAITIISSISVNPFFFFLVF